MPYPNEHSCRQLPPEDFDQKSFKRKNIANGVDIIIGKLKQGDGSMVTQTYRLSTNQFPTVTEAKKWLKDNDITCKGFEPASDKKDLAGEAIQAIS